MSYMFCQRDWYRLGVIQMVRLVEGRKVWSVLSWLLPRQPCMRGRSSRERVDLGLDVSQFQIVRLISYNFKAIRLSFFIFSARFRADSGELPSSLRLYEGLARLLPCSLRLLNIFCESRSPCTIASSRKPTCSLGLPCRSCQYLVLNLKWLLKPTLLIKQKQQTKAQSTPLLPSSPRSCQQYQQYFRMRLAILALLVLCLAAQDDAQPLSPQDEVALKEQEIRRQNNMSYTNVRAYTFVCGRFDDFVIKPSLTFETKIEMHVYWKKDNVYVSSEYLEGQEIRLIVYEDGQRVILDRSFYTTTGLTFTAKQGSSYIVRFLAAGTVTKLVSMITSTPIQVSEDVASKVHIDNAQTKIERMGNELKALLTISQRNFLMKEQIGQKILSSTQLYMLYEVFEVLTIIGVAIAQVVFLTRLLKGSSIV